MPGPNYGAGVYGDSGADETVVETVAAGPLVGRGDGRTPTVSASTTASAAPIQATGTLATPSVSSSRQVAATPITATAALTTPTTQQITSVAAGVAAGTVTLTEPATTEGWTDSADGPTLETTPGGAHDRHIFDDPAGQGPTLETRPRPTADALAYSDSAGQGPTLETRPGTVRGQIRAPIVSTVAPSAAVSERERIEGYLKTPFKTPPRERGNSGSGSGSGSEGGFEDGTGRSRSGDGGRGDFGAVMALLAKAAEDHAVVRDQMVYSRYIDTAIGVSLGNIGASVLVDRTRNADGTLESDEHYRIRIKAQRRALTGGGRLIEIRRGVASILGVSPGAVRVTENFAQEKAAFTVELTQRMLDESDTPIEYLVEFVDLIRAGGVKANLRLRGEFRHRAVGDLPDERHAYDVAPYTGDLRSQVD